ncbi:MAG: hypothetical protein ACFUZC_08650 [Chthoniobacteraceae bacterium]
MSFIFRPLRLFAVNPIPGFRLKGLYGAGILELGKEARLSTCIRLNTSAASATAQHEKTKPVGPVLSTRWYYI